MLNTIESSAENISIIDMITFSDQSNETPQGCNLDDRQWRSK